jgi:hypothetical protein
MDFAETSRHEACPGTVTDNYPGSEMNKEPNLYNQGKNAVAILMRSRRHGSYHVIRDPEGVFSLWAIEGCEREPFSLSFANRGRISSNIEDMPPEFVRGFVDYVRKIATP